MMGTAARQRRIGLRRVSGALVRHAKRCLRTALQGRASRGEVRNER